MGENCPKTLLDALTQELPVIDSTSWLDRLALGGAYVNGQRATTNINLSAPCKVEYFEPKFDIRQLDQHIPKFSPEQIVYEDTELIVVFKPIKLPCLPTRDQFSLNLKHYLEDYLGAKVHMPSRLDTSTQGLVVVSKSALMHNSLQQLFEKRKINKHYVLEVAGKPSWNTWVVTDSIGRDPQHAVLRKVLAPGSAGAKDAKTFFRALARSKEPPEATTLLEALPETGRTHQIRVHAASIGLPIVGDNFYGGPVAPSLHLLSYRVVFAHPINRKILDICVPGRLCPEWFDPVCLKQDCPL